MRWLSFVALVLSLLALSVSVYTWNQADARTESALQRREKSLVDKRRPAVVKMCKDFGVKEPSEDAQTLEELYAPLGGLFVGLGK